MRKLSAEESARYWDTFVPTLFLNILLLVVVLYGIGCFDYVAYVFGNWFRDMFAIKAI